LVHYPFYKKSFFDKIIFSQEFRAGAGAFLSMVIVRKGTGIRNSGLIKKDDRCIPPGTNKKNRCVRQYRLFCPDNTMRCRGAPGRQHHICRARWYFLSGAFRRSNDDKRIFKKNGSIKPVPDVSLSQLVTDRFKKHFFHLKNSLLPPTATPQGSGLFNPDLKNAVSKKNMNRVTGYDYEELSWGQYRLF
jgi:hypothetical protein